MQGQKGYVNDYVVIIFGHYINPFAGGRVREYVTCASFFVRFGRVGMRWEKGVGWGGWLLG